MEENVRLRNLVIKNDYKINEYGFYKLDKKNGIKTETLIVLDSEEDLYLYLGFNLIKPPTRDNLDTILPINPL